METKKVLIVANETAAGEHLRDAVLEELKAGGVDFHLVVPASPPKNGITWTEGEAAAHAKERLDDALAKLRETGARIEGSVGDPSPLVAIRTVMEEIDCDRIIVSTHPPGISKWLAMDLPHRVQREFDVEVTHLVATDSRIRDLLWSS